MCDPVCKTLFRGRAGSVGRMSVPPLPTPPQKKRGVWRGWIRGVSEVTLVIRTVCKDVPICIRFKSRFLLVFRSVGWSPWRYNDRVPAVYLSVRRYRRHGVVGDLTAATGYEQLHTLLACPPFWCVWCASAESRLSKHFVTAWNGLVSLSWNGLGSLSFSFADLITVQLGSMVRGSGRILGGLSGVHMSFLGRDWYAPGWMRSPESFPRSCRRVAMVRRRLR